MMCIINAGGSVSSGGSSSVANANAFDGQYLRKESGLIGAAATKLWTMSFWVKPSRLSVEIFSHAIDDGTVTAAVRINSSGYLLIRATNDSGTQILDAEASSSPMAIDTLYHVAFSIDLANTSNRAVRINRSAVTITWSTYTNDTIGIRAEDHPSGSTVGCYVQSSVAASGGSFFTGEAGEYWNAIGQYMDVGNTTNLNKLIDASGAAVNLGATGATPTGTVPRIFFSGVGADYATNKGTGGTFTQAGSGSITTTSTLLDV